MNKLVGGSPRIPVIRSEIQYLFPTRSLSTTLNQDGACARGATFSFATLSPVFRARESAIRESPCIPSRCAGRRATPTRKKTELVVFPHGNGIPSTKVLTFYRKAPFDIEAVYADPSALPGSINSWVGHLAVKDVRASPTGDCSTVRVKARLNLHGVLSLEAVYTEEVEEKEEMQVDGESSEPPKKKKCCQEESRCLCPWIGLDLSVGCGRKLQGKRTDNVYKRQARTGY